LARASDVHDDVWKRIQNKPPEAICKVLRLLIVKKCFVISGCIMSIGSASLIWLTQLPKS